MNLSSWIGPKPSERVAPPRVESAPIAFECIREAIHEVSNDSGVVTSRIIIGHVVLIHIDDDVLDSDGRVCSETLDTVSRIGGHSCTHRIALQNSKAPMNRLGVALTLRPSVLLGLSCVEFVSVDGNQEIGTDLPVGDRTRRTR